MFHALLQRQQHQIALFFSRIDVAACEELVEKMVACRGEIFCTGVGKCGFIAQKISATMLSTGTKSRFLPPLDAWHGDLGMVQTGDMVLVFSNSGETEELVRLLPYLRDRGAHLVALTAARQSRLAQQADILLLLPSVKEVCPFALAPTTSTVIQLLIGDALAMAVAEKRGFSVEQFSQNHPGGRIGKLASLRVSELMRDTSQIPLCLTTHQLFEVLTAFTDKQCGCLVVTDAHNKLQGIFTDGDLRRALQARGEEVLQERLEFLMTPTPKQITPDALAWEAVQVMEADPSHPVMVLPVVDETQEVVGLVKLHDLVQAGL